MKSEQAGEENEPASMKEEYKSFIKHYVSYYVKKYGYKYTRNEIRDLLRIKHLEEFLNTKRFKTVRNMTNNGWIIDEGDV